MKVLVLRKRRTSILKTIANIPRMSLKLLDANFVFQKTKTAFLYTFVPVVLCTGMMTEPRPASWFDIINILE